ncbi:Sec16b [Columba guinea]|nr:Sec16b [Columba guinea]
MTMLQRSRVVKMAIEASSDNIFKAALQSYTAIKALLYDKHMQGFEDPYQQYPAASYGDSYAHQSHQWQPLAWQDDRDLRQREPYNKSTNYQGQHYYRGYHPDLVATPPGQDRTQTYDSYKERYISAAQQEQAGGETLGSDVEEPGSREPSGQPNLLLQYRESGLSSSSYELSQYIRDGADHYDPTVSGTWSLAQAGRPSVSTPTLEVPHKFLLPHVVVCFGAGGQLVLVCPHQPAKGQLARVELHSLEVILQDTKEMEELQAFPGPLAREDLHKLDVITFCQQKITTSCDLSTQRGRDSALLWKFLVLLCQQNGSMVGSDTAELLMRDCRRQEKYKRQNPAANLIGLRDDEWMSRQSGTLDLITGEVPPVVETQAQIVEKFTKLLYYGRKKDALVWAMRNHLWGHALFLSSKMDPRTYSWVLTGFTSTLVTNDPLQTLFQLMSGRIPQAALCCGDATWGDWRPHLAVMLSNKVGDMELNHRAIVTMGDTLAGRGAIEAAHFCYLVADIPFGYFGAKAARMALLGSSHRQTFAQFARTEAIQRMEVFEYCQQLRQPESFLLPFQLGERLKLSDPLLLEMPEQDQMLEPDWLVQLRACCREWEETDGEPGYELPQSESYQYDQWNQSVPPQGPSSHEDMSLQPPAPVQVTALPVLSVGQELQPPAFGPGTITPPGEIFAEPPPQMVPPAGDAGEAQGALLAPSGVRPSLPAEQEEVKARTRTISECSSISLEDDSRPSSESVAEDTAEELAPAEKVKPGEDKGSGFRWFGWFRSKPNKETSSKAASETDPDSPTLGQQTSSNNPPPPVGAVPLFNPFQVSQLTVTGRCYPACTVPHANLDPPLRSLRPPCVEGQESDPDLDASQLPPLLHMIESLSIAGADSYCTQLINSVLQQKRLVGCLEVTFFRPINETLPVVLPLGGGSKEGDVKKKWYQEAPAQATDLLCQMLLALVGGTGAGPGGWIDHARRSQEREPRPESTLNAYRSEEDPTPSLEKGVER